MDGAYEKGQVAVALSGGLDSLYSLLALREAGVEVFGLHALFLPPYLRGPEACAVLERLGASLASLGVRLHVADLSGAFESEVIRPFVTAYLEGKTPNPCAFCNRSLKFGLLREEAFRLGASRIATGHYVKRLDFSDGPAILAGDDESKDQSYFLALTPPQSLARAIFPLARRKKADIARELAKRGLEAPQRGESQEICFIPGDDYRVFLRASAERFGLALGGPGPIRLSSGELVGRHNGLWAYTQGQRHGLGVAWSEPLYVLGKEARENTLIVGPKSSFRLGPCLCRTPNCLAAPALWPETVLVKTRYRQRPAPARAEFCTVRGEKSLRLHFLEAEAQAPAAPGQVAALYAPTEHGLRLLAGAEIIV